MNKGKIALIGFMAALTLTGCADRQGLSGNSAADGSVQLGASNDIGADGAEKAALNHSGLTEDEITVTKTEYDRVNKEYEIEFTADGYRYEYDISAADGSIIEFSKKIINSSAAAPDTSDTALPDTAQTDLQKTQGASSDSAQSTPPEGARITSEDARTAALSHAGVTASGVTFTKTKLDYDNGREEYDIEFVTSDYEYEYEIDAESGTVLSSSKEAIKQTITTNTAAGRITLEEAKTAALSHAGVTASGVTFTKTKLDYDNGREEYDIEFVTSDYEYEYEIDAESGTVLSSSKEAIKKTITTNTAAGRITLEEAKTAALNHAGVSASGVTYTKTKLDYDNGREEYDIEFVTSDYEYEYEIDANNGTVLSSSKEAIKKTITTNTASGRITLEEAKTAALNHAGVSASGVTFTETKLDRDDGREEYEIKFVTSDYKYEYEIDANNGAVLSSSKEAIKKTITTNTAAGRITLEEAKTAALNHAGVSASGVTYTKTKLDRDDGREEYDIEFVTSDFEYEYEIDAESGTVLSSSKEAIKKTITTNTAAGRITLEEAKTAALNHAGVSASDVTFTETKLDRDDGREEYEIKFVTSDYKYEYEIDANNGAVLSSSKEAIKHTISNSAAGGRITLDEAKAAALNHAGFTTSGVTFTKTKLERDDGREEYEIEFYANGREYEYVIDAASGEIIEYETDD